MVEIQYFMVPFIVTYLSLTMAKHCDSIDILVLKARSHRPKCKDYAWIANNSRLLREFYAIAGFERFKTLLRIQIDVFLTRINVFLTKLTPYVIRAQIARHVQPLQIM